MKLYGEFLPLCAMHTCSMTPRKSAAAGCDRLEWKWCVYGRKSCRKVNGWNHLIFPRVFHNIFVNNWFLCLGMGNLGGKPNILNIGDQIPFRSEINHFKGLNGSW